MINTSYINGLADRTITIRQYNRIDGNLLEDHHDVVIVDKIIKDNDTMYMVQFPNEEVGLIYPADIIKFVKQGFEK
jgi:ABC-type xylose transport system substrate-binding protein